MVKITSHYGISGPVPFVDVEIDSDNHLYVDPHAIRSLHTPQKYADQALECMDTFAREVTDSITTGTVAAQSRGKLLLQRFAEPWETRLGMAKSGFHGHGGADVVGAQIWEALNSDVRALVRVGILKQIEDIPLFVEGVDRDITSDITTRIIFAALAQFTQRMTEEFPQFTAAGHTVQTYRKQIWNPTIGDWSEQDVTLPVANGMPLLLVPREWVRPTLLMSATRYYKTSVLSFAQSEQVFLTPDGKLAKTPKHKLMQQTGLGRGRGTNIRTTLRAFDNGENLLETFKGFVSTRFPETARAYKRRDNARRRKLD